MVLKKKHHFLAQFSIPFHMWSVLLRLLAKKNIQTGWNSLTANQKLLFDGFWSQNLQQNRAHHVKGYGKLCQKMMSFLVYHFVWGHFGVLQNVEYFVSQAFKCALQIRVKLISTHACCIDANTILTPVHVCSSTNTNYHFWNVQLAFRFYTGLKTLKCF